MEQVQRLACTRAVLIAIGFHILGGCTSASKPEVKSVEAMLKHPPADAARPKSASTGQRFKECPECPEMIVLPAGAFKMGAPQSEAVRDNEGPQHRVTIERPFAIGIAAVTRGEYGMFVREAQTRVGDGCYVWAGGSDAEKEADASWHNPGANQTDRDPVVCVNWEDAAAYVAWINGKVTLRAREDAPYRLPTEAEWEYAAHAGTTTRHWWGGSADSVCRYANGADLSAQKAYPDWTAAGCDDGYVSTSPSGTFAANGFGLYDMAGNASQWIEDCYHDDYTGAPADGSAWTSDTCDRRVVRGGSWHSAPADLRVARRGGFLSSLRSDAVGFRVVRILDY